MSRVAFNCPSTLEPVGLPLTADSIQELTVMSFHGVTLDECPLCGQPHEVERDECFLLDDEEGTAVATRR
jgi:hypothetical protein